MNKSRPLAVNFNKSNKVTPCDKNWHLAVDFGALQEFLVRSLRLPGVELECNLVDYILASSYNQNKDKILNNKFTIF
jgi:hypothetical protein